MLSAFEASEQAPGCHQEHDGRAREAPGSPSTMIFSFPFNALQIPTSLSCEFSGLCSVGMSGWEWTNFNLGLCDLGYSYVPSEPQIPLYQ